MVFSSGWPANDSRGAAADPTPTSGSLNEGRLAANGHFFADGADGHREVHLGRPANGQHDSVRRDDLKVWSSARISLRETARQGRRSDAEGGRCIPTRRVVAGTSAYGKAKTTS